jgi:hypothetical protein
VLVDPIKWLPDMGHLMVPAGAKYMQFECMPQAEARARRILQLAEAARERYASGAYELGAAQQGDEGADVIDVGTGRVTPHTVLVLVSNGRVALDRLAFAKTDSVARPSP